MSKNSDLVTQDVHTESKGKIINVYKVLSQKLKETIVKS